MWHRVVPTIVLFSSGCGPGVWLDRYDRAFEELEAGYAFTQHKELDWASIDSEVRPLVESAANAKDSSALDQALRVLVAAIPDNHIELDADDCDHTEASFGLVLSDTDDEGVIVVRVLDPSLDLVAGEHVLSWNGVDIAEARLTAPTACLAEGIATVERLAFEQLRYLTRGAEGESATVLTDSGEHSLVAAEDEEQALEVFDYPDWASNHPVNHRIDGRIGVITISSEGGGRSQARVRRALKDFDEAGVTAVVLDLRGNTGGSDPLAARLAGFFRAESRFYQYEAYANEAGVFEIDLTYTVEPQDDPWTGPMAVLIDGFTVSSGEGLAMAAGWREDAVVVGFERSAASFGFTGESVSIAGRRLYYPSGQSWDEDERIQLDSDASMEGGVRPEHRVPWTAENRIDYASGIDVVYQEAVDLLSE